MLQHQIIESRPNITVSSNQMIENKLRCKSDLYDYLSMRSKQIQ